jgi:hypothetical protein
MKISPPAGLRAHSLFGVYAATLLWLLASCAYFASSAHISLTFAQPLLLFCGVFVALYAALAALVPEGIANVRSNPLPEPLVHRLVVVLFVVFAGVAVMHLGTLGYLPIVRAFHSTNDYEIARIRQEGYYSLAVWQRYASDYAFKGIGPILLVLAAEYRSRLLLPALVVGVFYATSLFVKADSVYLLLPLVLFFVLRRRYGRAMMAALLMVASVGVNWSTSSPPVRADVSKIVAMELPGAARKPAPQVPGAAPLDTSLPGATVLASLRERFVIVPAQVTAQWFTYYQDAENREGGCGYRVLARIMGCEYQHVPTKMYGLYYADNVQKRGLTGSLNTGSYLLDFANFGYPGVAVGAAVFAVIFTALRFLCRSSAPLLALNLMPVLSLPEMPITTVLNSGGWLLIMLISLLLLYGGGLRPAPRAANA